MAFERNFNPRQHVQLSFLVAPLLQKQLQTPGAVQRPQRLVPQVAPQVQAELGGDVRHPLPVAPRP